MSLKVKACRKKKNVLLKKKKIPKEIRFAFTFDKMYDRIHTEKREDFMPFQFE